MGWKLQTTAAARPAVEAALKAEGFVAGPEIKLASFKDDAATQFLWERQADWTHAGIVTRAEPKGRITVYCQAPQRPPR